MDNLYRALNKVGGRNPSKELYNILVKEGIPTNVVIGFINCKDIGYHVYLDIESINYSI